MGRRRGKGIERRAVDVGVGVGVGVEGVREIFDNSWADEVTAMGMRWMELRDQFKRSRYGILAR